MTIDRTPRLGRTVFAESKMLDGFVGRYGKITKVTERQVSFLMPNNETTHTPLRCVMVICDTNEEKQAILDFNERAISEMQTLRNELREQWKTLTGQDPLLTGEAQ